ncbi:MAG: hypothetical protein K2X66_10475 [Cyanobacteria bacterium]|nr:hypothetical protein [Cyanobacteriota bacterium]
MFNQLDIENATFQCNASGVPRITVPQVGDIGFHPGYVGLYALEYAGVEQYDSKFNTQPDEAKFLQCVEAILENFQPYHPVDGNAEVWGWMYQFDHIYNETQILSPWMSAFGQAVCIQALVHHYKRYQNPTHLEIAEKAAQAFYIPVEEGGLLFLEGEGCWFEEIPHPVIPKDTSHSFNKPNPTHILNGHMRALLAIQELSTVSSNPIHLHWFTQGIRTLAQWLPLYDCGYWLRYDLQPKTKDLLFRFNNPYGFPLHPLAIASIRLCDPLDARENNSPDPDSSTLWVGDPNDAEGPQRIAGIDWGAPGPLPKSEYNNLEAPVRCLQPVQPAPYTSSLTGEFLPPHTYFYLSLPTRWHDNLRQEPFVLEMSYWDDGPANINIQMRSICPGPVFRDLPEGDIFLSGSQQWRTWKIPVYPHQLGGWVGDFYAEKHYQYLEKLCQCEASLEPWRDRAKGFLRANQPFHPNASSKIQIQKTKPLPQTCPLPHFTLDENGVIQQFFPVEVPEGDPQKRQDKPELEAQNSQDSNVILLNSANGLIPAKAVYQVFGVAMQVINIDEFIPSYHDFRPPLAVPKIDKEPALEWLLNPENFHQPSPDCWIYPFQFNNSYNNIMTPAPWQSAFAQAYVIKAFVSALQQNLGNSEIMLNALQKTMNGFTLTLENGGLLSQGLDDCIFAEEVPNGTHILNGHLISCNALLVGSKLLAQYNCNLYNRPLSAKFNKIVEKMIASLAQKLQYYDSGYWSLYDQNPKSEVLLQIDWIQGTHSPGITEIYLENTLTGAYIFIDATSEQSVNPESPARLSGLEWKPVETKKNRLVRSFENGYSIHPDPLENAHRHNVFVILPLPNSSVPKALDIHTWGHSPYRLAIHYYDELPGQFHVNIQSIHQGNHLDFIPLKRGRILCTGSQTFQQATFFLGPQDLGWYVGEYYQQFHLKCLKELLAEIQGSDIINPGILKQNGWLIQQYIDKWTYYLNQYELNASPIISSIVSENLTPIVSKYKDALGKKRCPSPKNHSLYSVISTGKQFLAQLSKLYRHPKKFFKKKISPTGSIQQPFPQIPVNKLIWKADDPQNPLHPLRMEIPQAILDETLEILKNHPGDTPHQIILGLMKHLESFERELVEDSAPLAVLKNKKGACGDFSNVMLAMLSTVGIKGRLITLANYPKDSGHAVIECWVQGQWQLYDPTFGSFFTTTPNDLENPYVLSFQELRAGKGRENNVVEIIQNPQRLEAPSTLRTSPEFLGPGIYENANPAGPFGPNLPMVYPLTLDLHQPQPLTYSQLGTVYQGAGYLGAAFICNLHRWSLIHLTPGRVYEFIITPTCLVGEPQQECQLFGLEAFIQYDSAIFQSGQSIQWVLGENPLKPCHIRFLANQETVTLNITHPYRGPLLWYVSIDSYQLIEITT